MFIYHVYIHYGKPLIKEKTKKIKSPLMPPVRDSKFPNLVYYSVFYTYLHKFSVSIELERYCVSGLPFHVLIMNIFPHY